LALGSLGTKLEGKPFPRKRLTEWGFKERPLKDYSKKIGSWHFPLANFFDNKRAGPEFHWDDYTGKINFIPVWFH